MSQEDVIAKIKSIEAKSKTSTLMDSVSLKRNKIIKDAKKSIAINDAYGNKLTGTGTDDKVKSFATYGLNNDSLNWPLWTALYNDSWVFKRAIDKPSQDMVRAGITLVGQDEKLPYVYKDLKKFSPELIQIFQWGALYGGAIGVMMFDNIKDCEMKEALNIDKIKSSKSMKIYVTDRWYGVAPSTKTVDDMKSLDFGKPEYYDITFADGRTVRVHHDYILRYEHRVAPRFVKNMLQGWGYAEGAHILNELSRDDQLKSSITSLVNKALIEVIKMPGMKGVFMGADEDNERQLTKRLEMVNWGRNFNSLTFLDSEDEYQQNEFSGISGLSDLLEQNMWLVSAALDMQGVLFGHLNNGFSEDNEALERYDETILGRNENYGRPIHHKLITVLYIKYGIVDEVDFTYNSLLVKKHDNERIESIKSVQELLSSMLEDGVITTQIYAKTMQDYITSNSLSLNLDEKYIASLEEKIEEESEDFDLDEPTDESTKIL